MDLGLKIFEDLKLPEKHHVFIQSLRPKISVPSLYNTTRQDSSADKFPGVKSRKINTKKINSHKYLRRTLWSDTASPNQSRHSNPKTAALRKITDIRSKTDTSFGPSISMSFQQSGIRVGEKDIEKYQIFDSP